MKSFKKEKLASYDLANKMIPESMTGKMVKNMKLIRILVRILKKTPVLSVLVCEFNRFDVTVIWLMIGFTAFKERKYSINACMDVMRRAPSKDKSKKE